MTHSSSHAGKEFIVLMALLMSIVAISIDAFLPALGMIREELGTANPNHVQFLLSFIFIGMAIGQLICGPLSDAIGRKPVIYATTSLFFAGSILCYFSQNLEMLLFGRFIQGLGVSGPYVSTMSIVRDKYSGREMARIMSVVMMIFIMVPALAPSLGQAILLVAGWRYIFLFYIFYAAVIMLWQFFRLEETLPKPNRIPLTVTMIARGFKEVFTHPVTLGYTICMGLLFGSFIGYLNSSQQIFQVQFNTGQLFTVYFGLLALVFGVASLANSRFVEKLGMHYITIRGAYAIIASSLLFLAMHWLVDITLWMFLIFAVVLFFSFGMMFGNLNAIAMEPMGHIAGIASAVIGSVSSLISMLIGTWIGQMYDNSLIPVVSGFAFFGTLALLTMLYAEKKREALGLASGHA